MPHAVGRMHAGTPRTPPGSHTWTPPSTPPTPLATTVQLARGWRWVSGMARKHAYLIPLLQLPAWCLCCMELSSHARW
jgi:hypothetical protein